MRASPSLLVLLFLAGCGPATVPADAGQDAGPSFRAECENINPTDCLLPWPSSFFLADDPSTATGRRIAIQESAMPMNSRHQHVDPTQLARFDGFSPDPAIMTSYPGQVDPATLNDENAIDATLDASSSTLLIDAETGALVPHFAELDAWPETDPNRAPLYIRPAVRLQEGHRYVVATQGIKLVGGDAVEPSEYFRALRDGTPLQDTDVEDRRAHFEDVFSIITAAGVARETLIEAWDFETASGESLWGDLIAMRDDAVGRGDGDFGRAGERGLPCTVVNVEEGADADEHVYRWVEGTFTVPLYLNGTTANSAEESSLHRGPDGTPTANGTAEVHFQAQIPISLATRVAAGGAPGRLEVYGHGLFGSSGEITSGWHRDHQDRLGVVSVATEWWGMSQDDVPRVTKSLQEFSTFYATGERLQQGVINVLVLARAFMGQCSELPEMQIALDGDPTQSAPAIDTSAAYYYGNSQGGIMGGVVAGVAVDIERFVLGVGGMSYPLLIKRSADWRTFDQLMGTSYSDPLIRDLLLASSSTLWDIAEPATYAPHLVHDPLPGTPAKHILMQIGIGDSQVPNVGSALEARTIGIPYVTPSPWDPWGLESTTAPPADGSTLDSALVIYHIPGADMLPAGTRDPGEDTPAHEGVRRSTAAIDQIDAFWQTDGQITQTCDGVCDPT